ncbi:hypothetical protein HZU77_013095 [Neisseriaceae bacterium TC5R-5]|nr:hypothetical protein [Neisseriaceae bacterium TC5R-5]
MRIRRSIGQHNIAQYGLLDFVYIANGISEKESVATRACSAATRTSSLTGMNTNESITSLAGKPRGS